MPVQLWAYVSGAGRWEANYNLGKKYKIYWIEKRKKERKKKKKKNLVAGVLGNWVEFALTVLKKWGEKVQHAQTC